MIMTPRLRKFALTAHVTSSVGWLRRGRRLPGSRRRRPDQPGCSDGACRLSRDGLDRLVRHRPVLCLASLLTGLVSSLGTTWGLFRHYWVLVKLLITIPVTIVLLVHMQPISVLAGAAAKTTTLSSADLQGLRNLLVTAAGATVLVLLVLTTLSIYKPRGMTRYGWRKQRGQRASSEL